MLDADHAPFRSFLRETIGYFFEDDRLFLVQTPHVFLNPDPIEQNLRTFRRMPSENEMFYGITQRGLDKWNAAFFCGSAALLRRAALDETDGFSGVSVTEDCETALELHARGWTSVYVDKPLVAGLQPESFASFIGQRVRWCQGMLQIFLLRNPLLKRGLEPLQRLGYLSSMAFWLFPFPRLVFMLAPLAFILFDVKIFVSNIEEAIAYTATYVVVNAMLQNYLFGKVRWPWVSELYEYCQGVFLAKAIVSVVLRPRSPSFAVTTKGSAQTQDRLSEFAWPFFALYGLLALAAAVAVYRCIAEPGVRQLMFFVGLWNTFNLVTAGVALGAVAERRRRETHPRLAVERRGALALGEQHIRVAIEEVSAGGCRLRAATEADAQALAVAKVAEGRLVHRLLRRRRAPSEPLRAHREHRAGRTPLGRFRLFAAAGLSRARRSHVWRRDGARALPGRAPQAQGHNRRHGAVSLVGRDRAFARLGLSAPTRRRPHAARAAALRRSLHPPLRPSPAASATAGAGERRGAGESVARHRAQALRRR